MALSDKIAELFPERRHQFIIYFAVFTTSIWVTLATISNPPCLFSGPTGADPKEFAFFAIPVIGIILASWLNRKPPDVAEKQRDWWRLIAIRAERQRDWRIMLIAVGVITGFFWMGLITTCNCALIDANGALVGEVRNWFNFGTGGGIEMLCKSRHIWKG